jgi:hypothetical protein
MNVGICLLKERLKNGGGRGFGVMSRLFSGFLTQFSDDENSFLTEISTKTSF